MKIIIFSGKDRESANEPGTNPDPNPVVPTFQVSNQKDSIGTGWKIMQLKKPDLLLDRMHFLLLQTQEKLATNKPFFRS